MNVTDQVFDPTREVGLARLDAFVPRAGRAYAAERNYDYGPSRRHNISMLSPYIRHRLVTEDEVLRAVLSQHRLSDAEKFVQEVYWRTYWKGWLEQRPSVWSHYVDARDAAFAELAQDSTLYKSYETAINGQSGIEGFDDWSQELVETGYLHNHARMWFASIWIFTLKLPWVLGADFFMQHLCDGDPASNTLSWRWVAGLQTVGKVYGAARWNIEKFTDGRFAPHGLEENPVALAGAKAPPPSSIDWPAPMPDAPYVLAVTDDYCGAFDDNIIKGAKGVLQLDLANGRVHDVLGAKARAFHDGALHDAAGRLIEAGVANVGRHLPKDISVIADAIQDVGARVLVMPYVTVGGGKRPVKQLAQGLAKAGLAIAYTVNTHDYYAWPYATKGFFPFKAHIRDLVGQIDAPLLPL